MHIRISTIASTLVASCLFVVMAGCSSTPRGNADTGADWDTETDTAADTAPHRDTSAPDTDASDTGADGASDAGGETDSADTGADGASDAGGDTAEDGGGDATATDTTGEDTAGDTSGDATGASDTTADGGGDTSVCGPNAGSCASDQYCDYPDDRCGDGQTGTCQARPSSCPAVVDPVCGCDDTTYDNKCEAAAAGVDVQHQGRCNSGSDCTSSDECASDEFCEFPDDQCGDGQTGTCKPRPSICPAVVDPVCGCDNNTHNNQCEAAAAGTDVQYDGRCN